LNKRIKK